MLIKVFIQLIVTGKSKVTNILNPSKASSLNLILHKKRKNLVKRVFSVPKGKLQRISQVKQKLTKKLKKAKKPEKHLFQNVEVKIKI